MEKLIYGYFNANKYKMTTNLSLVKVENNFIVFTNNFQFETHNTKTQQFKMKQFNVVLVFYDDNDDDDDYVDEHDMFYQFNLMNSEF